VGKDTEAEMESEWQRDGLGLFAMSLPILNVQGCETFLTLPSLSAFAKRISVWADSSVVEGQSTPLPLLPRDFALICPQVYHTEN
jgi:hypothetical protein